MSWFKSRKAEGKKPAFQPPSGPPPGWTPAPERSHTWGLRNEATDDEFASAEAFCQRHPVEAPKLLSSELVDRIEAEGCRLWTIEHPGSDTRFDGQIQHSGEKGPGITRVVTSEKCGDVCLLSNLPLLAGLYDVQGKQGVYYEVCIRKMDGIIAMGTVLASIMCYVALMPLTGTVCRPYPSWRFPGWNRSSVGLHLDDMRKFFEDPCGGRDYTPLLTRISPGDTIGCGYDFSYSSVFFTYNGQRLPDAFKGVYVPRTQSDVYAAIGVEGACEFEVNFGGDVFRWKEGNEWSWRVEGHVGRLSGTSAGDSDQLPSYDEARRR